MRNPLTTLRIIGKKILSSARHKQVKSTPLLHIERKWWMGEDLFTDKKPLIDNTLKKSPVTG